VTIKKTIKLHLQAMTRMKAQKQKAESHKGVRVRAEKRKETKQALLQLLSGTQ
jgi:hypothetical protein